MTLRGLRLRHLSFFGPTHSPATIAFGPGLNVLHGASETGKSFVVEAIDFMLGGHTPLRDIPERVGYDRVLLGVETLEGDSFTLQRSTQGGPFRVMQGLREAPFEADEAAALLGDKHDERKPDNLSAYLLDRCGLLAKRVRKSNRSGETSSLSFRNLARLVVIEEDSMWARRSPLSDGNPALESLNVAVLRLLLTGVDDSALDATREKVPETQTREAQIDLLDQLLRSHRARLKQLTKEPSDLADQLQRIDTTLATQTEALSAKESDYKRLLSERRDLRKRLEESQERRSEIAALLERFELLDRHYVSDLARLRSIEEGGTLFEEMGEGPCPLCGADAEHHRRGGGSAVNVKAVVGAAQSEIAQIELLRTELRITVQELQREATVFDARLPGIERKLRAVADQIEQGVSPELGRLRLSYREFADKRAQVQTALGVLQNIQDFERRRDELEHGPTLDGGSAIADASVPVSVAESFAQRVEAMLTAWHFPDASRVYLDAKSRDLIIAGKHRTARGKGLRAITHAAFTLAILDHCRASGTPHPGFVVLDSPLVAYRAPEGKEDDLSGTDLQDQFYAYLAEWPADRQVLIVENVDPPESVRQRPQVTFFSRNPLDGSRYGFFPASGEPDEIAEADAPGS